MNKLAPSSWFGKNTYKTYCKEKRKESKEYVPPTVTPSITYGSVKVKANAKDMKKAKWDLARGQTVLRIADHVTKADKTEGKASKYDEDFDRDSRHTAIDSGLLPLSYPYDEDLERHEFDLLPGQPHEFTDVDCCRDVAISMFYRGDHDGALQIIGDVLMNDENRKIEGMHPRLVELECKLYRIQNNMVNDPHCDLKSEMASLDHMIADCEGITEGDLLQLAYILQGTERHYGSFLICRATVLKLPVYYKDSPRFRKWYFDLAYFLFVEMAFRAFTMIKGRSPVNKCLFRSMKRVLNKIEAMREDDNNYDKYDENEKLAICYICLAYCCNEVGLYEDAVRCADAGLECARQSFDWGIVIGIDRKLKVSMARILGDLLLTKALALLEQGEYDGTKYSADEANKYIGMSDYSEDSKCKRKDLITKIKKLVKTLPRNKSNSTIASNLDDTP